MDSKRVNNADDSGTDTDDEGRLIQQAAATAKKRGSEPPRSQPVPGQRPAARAPPLPVPPSKPPPLRPAPRPAPATTAKGKAAPKRPAGAVTVRTLLDAGFLVPGCKVLYVEYKGLITWADLTEEGSIVCDGQSFESPSAFSIFVKRKLNPDRKADDGWKAVKYAGKLLEHFKEQYLRQQLAASGLGGGTVRGATPSGSVGPSGTATGPSPHSSVHHSPQRHGEDNGVGEDGPPSKRQRTDADGDAPGGGGGASRPGLKIKLKLKDGPGGGIPSPGGRPSGTGGRNGAVHTPPGPLLPLPAPAVAQVPCGEYSGVPGSGAPGSQPFRLEVSDGVVIVMDFHAHCSASEVGGLLGGSFDETSRTLVVSRAFPVLEAPQAAETTTSVMAATEGGGTGGGGGGAAGSRPPVAVTFDATDLARVREVIRNWGLDCVGSYRSHPGYSAQPNALDVVYMARSQREARTPSGVEPYVCAVLAPYDPDLKDPPSGGITWFHVRCDKSVPLPPASSSSPPAGCQPMALVAQTAEAPTAHMDIMNLVSTQFQHTARTYAMRPTRTPLALQWRPRAAPAGAAPAAYGTTTHLDKLVGSVVSRLPDMFEGDLRIRYGNMVRDMVRHEFSLAERMGGQRSGASGRGVHHHGRGSEDGGGSEGGGGCLAVERSRRPARFNGAVVAAARFDSDEEETEEEDDEVRLDEDDEAMEAEDDEM